MIVGTAVGTARLGGSAPPPLPLPSAAALLEPKKDVGGTEAASVARRGLANCGAGAGREKKEEPLLAAAALALAAVPEGEAAGAAKKPAAPPPLAAGGGSGGGGGGGGSAASPSS